MKKLLFLLLSFMLVLTLVACGDANMTQAKGLWNQVVGSWKCISKAYFSYESNDFENPITSENTDLITLTSEDSGVVTTSIKDIEKDLKDVYGKYYKGFYKLFDNVDFYQMEFYNNIIKSYKILEDNKIEIIVYFIGSRRDWDGISDVEVSPFYKSTYERIIKTPEEENPDESEDTENDNSTDEEESLDFSVLGTWNYKVNNMAETTLTLSEDDTFEFINKLTNREISGTYSLSGNKITFEFEADGIGVKDIFTVSGNEDEITFTLIESNSSYNGQSQPSSTTLSALLNTFYSIVTSTSVTLSK